MILNQMFMLIQLREVDVSRQLHLRVFEAEESAEM